MKKTIRISTLFYIGLLILGTRGLIDYADIRSKQAHKHVVSRRVEAQIANVRDKRERGDWTKSSTLNDLINKTNSYFNR